MAKCQQIDCQLPGSEYQINDEVFVLCSDHASAWGFCPGCGWMAAGADDDFIVRHGICYECWCELQDELAADEDNLDLSY